MQTEVRGGQDGRSVTRSWVSLALVPVFFILAMAAGEGIYALLGYAPENADAPFWVAFGAGIPALVVLALPCVGAIFYGWRAQQAGDHRALASLVIAGIVLIWFTTLTVVGLAVGPV
jgi:hypothetical protein